ncbi:MAG: hypothetical protein AAF264_00210 [Pseudomonadota bacterium]
MKPTFTTGYLVGTGSEQNVPIGFAPDWVKVVNVSDSTSVYEGYIGPYVVIPFSSGGTEEIKVGQKITGLTSGATATVREVLLGSGSFTAGSAAGFLVVHLENGTFTGEGIRAGDGTTDVGTITAAVTHTISVTDSGAGATDVAAATGNAAITPYAGEAGGDPAGFTIGSTISANGKLLRYVAARND